MNISRTTIHIPSVLSTTPAGLVQTYVVPVINALVVLILLHTLLSPPTPCSSKPKSKSKPKPKSTPAQFRERLLSVSELWDGTEPFFSTSTTNRRKATIVEPTEPSFEQSPSPPFFEPSLSFDAEGWAAEVDVFDT
jgi:hypothetical protein